MQDLSKGRRGREEERGRKRGKERSKRDSGLSRVSISINARRTCSLSRNVLYLVTTATTRKPLSLLSDLALAVLSIPSDHEDSLKDVRSGWKGRLECDLRQASAYTSQRGCVKDEFLRVITTRLIFPACPLRIYSPDSSRARHIEDALVARKKSSVSKKRGKNSPL